MILRFARQAVLFHREVDIELRAAREKRCGPVSRATLHWTSATPSVYLHGVVNKGLGHVRVLSQDGIGSGRRERAKDNKGVACAQALFCFGQEERRQQCIGQQVPRFGLDRE